MRTITTLLDDAERAAGHRPFVTFRDLGTGERTELGMAAAANWVRKTANLLTGEFAIAPGALVGVAPFAHWLAPVLALAAWACGGGIATDGQASVWFAAEDHAAGCPRRPLIVVGRGLGGRCAADPAALGASFGLAEEVLAFPDRFDAPDTDPAAWALRAETTLTHDELLSAEPRGARALLDAAPFSAGWCRAVVAALAGGGGIVLLRAGDDEQRARATAEERVDEHIA